jgi:hypothetical protein
MFEGIQIGIADVGPWGLLILENALLVLLVSRGIWLHRSVHSSVVEMWIKVADANEARADKAMDLLVEAQEGTRTAVAALQSIKDEAARRRTEAGGS